MLRSLNRVLRWANGEFVARYNISISIDYSGLEDDPQFVNAKLFKINVLKASTMGLIPTSVPPEGDSTDLAGKLS